MRRVGKCGIKFGITLFLILSSFSVMAQAHRVQFGKNRIQYKYFDWQYYHSDNFEVYFYQGGQDLAKRSIEYLEAEFSRITETIGYPPYSKTRVFLYNSISDKQQSNVGVKGKDFTVGGQTNFVKSQVEIAYSGDYSSFRKKLIFGVTDMLVQEMLFGGNIAEMFQSTFSSPIPRWFTSGVSAYVAYGWDKESDDLVREYTYNNQTDRFVKLSPEANVLIGQSIWNFVAQRYGQRSISNILNLARIIRNEENSIARTLGLPFDRFMAEWRAYYNNIQVSLLESYKNPSEEYLISGKNTRAAKYTSVKFSPDGNLLAYASMDEGKYEVYVRNLTSNKEILLHKGGNRLLNQEVDRELPLLSWADETTLGIITKVEGRNTLTIKRVGSKGKQLIGIPRLSRIQSFNFKYKGRIAVLTGDLNGRSDAFLFNINRGQIRRITNDNFDVRDASFVPETNIVLFSSNRSVDTVYLQGPDNLEDSEVHKFNVFSYDLDILDTVYTKLTNTLAMDALPYAGDGESVFFVSDQQGINNLYKHTRVDSLSVQLTRFLYGIKNYDIDFNNKRLAYVSTRDSKDAIFMEPLNMDQSLFTPVTPRRGQETTRILAEMRRKRLVEEQAKDTSREEQTTFEPVMEVPKRDSTREGAINTESYQFTGRSKVDTKDYKFERPAQKQETPAGGRSFLNIYQNVSTENQIKGPVPYETRFQTDNVVTTFVIDEIRSFSQLMEIQMNDFLENHRFYGGLLIPYNFNSGFDVFGEYHYLKHRIDLKARYYRRSIQREDNISFRQRYNLNRFELGAAMPFSPYLRFEFSTFFTQTKYLDLNPALLLTPSPSLPEPPEVTANYAGARGSLVYDNSIVIGTNVHEGTRAKVTFETHRKVNDQALSFNNFEVDLRHYQRLTRGIYAAARFHYGTYFGDAPKRYLLGGVDNWAFNKTESTGDETDPLSFETLVDNSDVLFNQFTNLRGYSYNTFQGRNVLTFSGELRMPVAQLLNNKELRSNFLRNLQFVGFYDIGSAWDDLSPFKDQNNLNIEVIDQEGSPFSAVINNFNNPWLQSTGVGMRTMLFGFFSRLDLSWPIQNFEVQSPRFQVSFGYDF